MKKSIASLIAFAALAFGQVAMAQQWDIGAQSRQRQEALSTGQVFTAVVVQVREIEVAPSNTNTYAATGLGTALGALIASRAGNGNGRYVASALGGVIGAVAGGVAGNMLGGTKAQEIIVRFNTGNLAAITQTQSSLSPGQQVYLVESAGKIRVTPMI